MTRMEWIKKKENLSLFSVMLVSFLLYLNAIPNGFVYDDPILVSSNPFIRDLRNIPQMFSTNFWGFMGGGGSNNYRPLVQVINALTFQLFGLKAWGFHLVNVLFHMANCVLVYLIIARLLPGRDSSFLSPALVGGLLFAAHPVHTEAVDWISSPDVQFSFFLFLSFFLYMRARAGGKLNRLAFSGSLVSYLFSALCKEPGFLLPLVLVAYDYSFKKEFKWKTLCWFLLPAGTYLILRYWALGGLAPEKYTWWEGLGFSGFQIFINIFPLFIKYLEKLLLPIRLNALYVYHIHSLWEIFGIFSLFCTGAYICSLLYTARKYPLVFFGLSFIIIPLLPLVDLRSYFGNTMAERYLYLPSFGLVFLASLFFLKKKGKLAAALFSVVFLLYSVGTITRNPVWKDDFSLWSDTVRKSPESAGAHNGLGNVLLERKQFDGAIEQFRIAVALSPDEITYYDNLGAAYYKKGMFDDAITVFKNILKLRPDLDEIHFNLGLALQNKGLLDEAASEFRTAININPGSNAYVALGNILMLKGDSAGAAEQYRRALEINPDNPVIAASLRNALAGQNQ